MSKPLHFSMVTVTEPTMGTRIGLAERGASRSETVGHIGTPIESDEMLEQLRKEVQELTQRSEFDEEYQKAEAAPASRACEFLASLQPYSSQEGKAWTAPETDTSRDGGVQFYWYTPAKQTILTFRPQNEMVDVHIKEAGQPAERQLLPPNDAIAAALSALRDE